MHRRHFLSTVVSTSATSLSGLALSGMLPRLATAASQSARRRSCIILWMSGGPSQTDTFDMKPNHRNGGEFAEVATNVPGVRFSEHLPELGKRADKLAIVRTLTSKEGDHERGSYFLQTGHKQGGPIKPPAMRSLLGHQLSPDRTTLPPLVSIGGNSSAVLRPVGPGFLGSRYQPLDVSVNQFGTVADPADEADIRIGTPASLAVNALSRFPTIDDARWNRRLRLWETMEGRFLQDRNSDGLRSHQATYQNAHDLMTSGQADVFDLTREDATVRNNYGVGTFGQGCLMARRLVEAGVACVEVTLSNSTIGNYSWDSHSQNFTAVESLSRELDAGFSALLDDLESRGLLETTTVVCVGEFGRTPTINNNAGRDHFPGAFAGIIAGGKTAMGQTYGKTSKSGMQIEENPVTIPQWLATICAATGIDPADTVQNESGRPVPIVDAEPVGELIV